MGRFLVLTIFFVVALGLVLHFDVELPWYLDWFGKLPGDILIQKGGALIYFPLATSVLLSFVFSLVLYLLFGNKN